MKPWQPVSNGREQCVAHATAQACALVVTIVAERRGVKRSGLLAASRSRSNTAEARQLAMYLCHTLLEISLSEVGRYFGRHRTTVSHACTMIEDGREDGNPADIEISSLEAEIKMRRAAGVGPISRFQVEEMHHG
jgi:chromosomal replication initiation ATPase DnaA